MLLILLKLNQFTENIKYFQILFFIYKIFFLKKLGIISIRFFNLFSLQWRACGGEWGVRLLLVAIECGHDF